VRLIGPPAVGTFGDPACAMFIAVQIHRILPDILTVLSARGPVGSAREEGLLRTA